MFLDINDLAQKKIRIRKSYAPGTLDFHSGEFRQIEPLEVRATAELAEDQIRVYGNLHTRIEMVCARCLDTVVEEISRDFDLYHRPMAAINEDDELQLDPNTAEVAFYEGDGMFLADILAEQVLLGLPMKVICRSDCRGLCAHCGACLLYTSRRAQRRKAWQE